MLNQDATMQKRAAADEAEALDVVLNILVIDVVLRLSLGINDPCRSYQSGLSHQGDVLIS